MTRAVPVGSGTVARSLADAEAGRLRLVDQDPTTFQLVLATVPGGG